MAGPDLAIGLGLARSPRHDGESWKLVPLCSRRNHQPPRNSPTANCEACLGIRARVPHRWRRPWLPNSGRRRRRGLRPNHPRSGRRLAPIADEIAAVRKWSACARSRPRGKDQGKRRERVARFLLASPRAFRFKYPQPDRVCPAPAACGEDFVSATGAIIDGTRAVPLSAASPLGVFTLLLTSP